MPQKKRYNSSFNKVRKSFVPMGDGDFSESGYYMWDLENEIAFPRKSYVAALCTAVAANKKNGQRHAFRGIYYSKGVCFVTLDFVDTKLQEKV